MTTPDTPAKKVVKVEILHLDKIGYGYDGTYTRREWRAECLAHFEAGAAAFLAWQDSWQAKAEQNDIEVNFGVRLTFDDGSREQVFDSEMQSHCLDFAGHTFEKYVDVQGYPFLNQALFFATTFTDYTDFSEATFTDYTDFSEATFTGNTYFHETTFTGDADFSEATFKGDADFSKTTFKGNPYFNETTFTGDAHFRETTFTGDAHFRETTFTGKADFRKTTFTGNADFSETTFTGDAHFRETTFTSYAYFSETTFTGNAYFGETTFTGNAYFSKTTFTSYAHFRETTFTGDAHFGGTTFKGDAYFRETTFTGDAHFGGTTFKGDAYFIETTFASIANFSGTTFTGNAAFSESTFADYAGFSESTFTSEANFESANFEGLTDFLTAKFHNQTHFSNAKFKGASNFENATFANVGHFEGAKFKGKKAKIPSFRGVDVGNTRLEFSDDTYFTKADFDEEAVKNIAFLKHLSEQHGQIDQALNFNAMELRAKYLQVDEQLRRETLHWLEAPFKRVFSGTWWSLRLTWLYGVLSDFGRSYMRPLLAYGAVFLFTWSFALYVAIDHKPESCPCNHEFFSLECDGKPQEKDEKLYLDGYDAAFNYAMYHATGLIDFTGDSKLKDAINQRLFDEPIKPIWARVFGALLSLLNTALLFLIALGLRNNYRLK